MSGREGSDFENFSENELSDFSDHNSESDNSNVVENNIQQTHQFLGFNVMICFMLMISVCLLSFTMILCVEMICWPDKNFDFYTLITFVRERRSWIMITNTLGSFFVSIVICSLQNHKKLIFFINSHACSIALVPIRCPVYVYFFIFLNFLFGFSDSLFVSYTITYLSQIQTYLPGETFIYVHNIIFIVFVIIVGCMIDTRCRNSYLLVCFTCFILLFVIHTIGIDVAIQSTHQLTIQYYIITVKEVQKVIVTTLILQIVEQTSEMNFFLISFHPHVLANVLNKDIFFIMGITNMMSSLCSLIIMNYTRKKQLAILMFLSIFSLIFVFINLLYNIEIFGCIVSFSIALLVLSWFFEIVLAPNERIEVDIFSKWLKFSCGYLSLLIQYFILT